MPRDTTKWNIARIAARHFKTDHHEYYVTPDDLVRSIAGDCRRLRPAVRQLVCRSGLLLRQDGARSRGRRGCSPATAATSFSAATRVTRSNASLAFTNAYRNSPSHGASGTGTCWLPTYPTRAPRREESSQLCRASTRADARSAAMLQSADAHRRPTEVLGAGVSRLRIDPDEPLRQQRRLRCTVATRVRSSTGCWRSTGNTRLRTTICPR